MSCHCVKHLYALKLHTVIQVVICIRPSYHTFVICVRGSYQSLPHRSMYIILRKNKRNKESQTLAPVAEPFSTVLPALRRMPGNMPIWMSRVSSADSPAPSRPGFFLLFGCCCACREPEHQYQKAHSKNIEIVSGTVTAQYIQYRRMKTECSGGACQSKSGMEKNVFGIKKLATGSSAQDLGILLQQMSLEEK